jgi:hypothetical protein
MSASNIPSASEQKLDTLITLISKLFAQPNNPAIPMKPVPDEDMPALEPLDEKKTEKTARPTTPVSILKSPTTTESMTSSADNSNRSHFRPGNPPPYNGTINEVDAWIFDIEAFFMAANIKEEYQKIHTAVLALQDKPKEYFRYWVKNRGGDYPKDWAEMKQMLVKQYQPVSEMELARIQLDKLRRGRGGDLIKNIEEYIRQFQSLSTRITDTSTADRIHKFLNGLDHKEIHSLIRRAMSAFTPSRTQPEFTVDDAIMIAQREVTTMRGLPEYRVSNGNNNGGTGQTYNNYRNRFQRHRVSFQDQSAPATNNSTVHQTVHANPMITAFQQWLTEQGADAKQGSSADTEADINAIASRNNARPVRSKLTDGERVELMKIGGCFYCRQPGHMASQCPHRPKN